jgi:hypothetical protein
MSDEISKVRSLLEAAQRKLKELDRQALTLRAEIAAYERVCLILVGEDPPASNGRSGHGGEGSGTRKRGLSETWQKVVYWIATQSAPPETENIYTYTQEAGLDINRNTLRSQLSVYSSTNQDILRRVDGHYFVTQRGLDMLQNKPPDELPSQDEPEQYSTVFKGVPAPDDEKSDLDDEIPF